MPDDARPIRADADPIPIAQALMRCASITPVDAGALDVAETALKRLGFATRRMKYNETDNLYARRGTAAPNFCFAGHVDVVPPGAGWAADPFSAEVKDGWLIGRGAADMKGAIAAMIAGVEGYLAAQQPKGSISFLLTGDEEGPALDGTQRVLRALAEEGERIDHCIVGEPTSEERVGDVIKNGRRGSLNCVLTVSGKQGHVAYPERALNPVTPLVEILSALKARKLDDGAPGFVPSNLEVTTVDVANPPHNVIPSRATAKLNIRFNTNHAGEDLADWIKSTAEQIAARYGASVEANIVIGARPFHTAPGAFTEIMAAAVRETLGVEPMFSTTGGTSDARYIKDYCPVAELGPQNATAHMVDERIRVDDIRALAKCYAAVLAKYFA
jgi:succinyl-diaminopimelate desuccinylase